MKRLLLLALVCLFAPLGYGQTLQNPLQGPISAASSTCAPGAVTCVWMKLAPNQGTVAVTVSGTFSATLSVEESSDNGTTFVILTSLSAAVTAQQFSVAGMTDFRVRGSAYTSGSALVNLQSSTASGGSSSSGSGIPTVTRGLIGDCPLSETSGTTISCGAAGAGTLGTTTAAPVFPSVAGVGTALAMDNFTNAALNTAGNWTTTAGTIVTAGGQATASAVAGNSQAAAVYTGIPSSGSQGQNQFVQVTLKSTPTTGWVILCVRCSTSGQNGYIAFVTNANTAFIQTQTAGVGTNVSTIGKTALVSGDVMRLSVQENQDYLGATITLTVNGVVITSGVDATYWNGQPGVGFAFTNPASPAIGNMITGSLDTNVQGGLLFGGGQNVVLPASLNAAQTIEIFACFQNTSNTSQYNAMIMGNGNGAASNAIGLGMVSAGSGGTILSGLPHLLSINSAGVQDLNIATPNGCTTSAIVYGTSVPNNSLDRIYMNGIETAAYGQNGRNALNGGNSAGAFNLGGSPAGSGFATKTFFTGTIYRVRFFNVALTPSEIAQDSSALNLSMIGRGLTPYLSSNATQDTCVAAGDSQTSGSGLGSPLIQAWTQITTFFTPTNSSSFANNGHCWNAALGGSTVGSQQQNFTNGSIFQAPDQISDPLYTPSGNRNVIVQWLGTNDLLFQGVTGSSQLLDTTANYAKQRKIVGWKVIVANVISRGAAGACTFDVNFQTYNPLLRQAWTQFADGYVDLASFTKFATGGCTNVSYFNADNVHPSAYGHSQVAFFMQREVNTLFGNRDWNSANTYTTTAAAATATTAGTASGSTGTITMAATQPFAAGQCVVVAGVTPAGWNTPAGDCYLVLTATSTQITLTMPSSGLGAISVQGTVTTSQELDQDQYAILGGAAAGPIHTLETCQGRIGHTIYRMVTNANATPWVLTPFQASETINGAATMNAPVATATNHPIVALKSILTSNNAGGCTWQASLQ